MQFDAGFLKQRFLESNDLFGQLLPNSVLFLFLESHTCVTQVHFEINARCGHFLAQRLQREGGWETRFFGDSIFCAAMGVSWNS